MRRAAALVALALLIAGCGSGSSTVPRGNPDARFGPGAVDDYAAVELLRAQLIASSDPYYAGGSASDARIQLQQARSAYDVLAARVHAKDPVVDREVVARFNVVARDIRNGVAPDHYRDLVGPLADQLMDGVSQALVPPKARGDRGLQAEALRRVTTRLAATYDAAAAVADNTTTRLAFQDAWGLWRRALSLNTLIRPDLGSQKDTISNTLANLRGTAFPNGPRVLDSPPAQKVDNASTKVVDALDKRFGFVQA